MYHAFCVLVFLDTLPRNSFQVCCNAGRSTSCFSSEDASGSTSQAANIQEALEVGATTLLVDEDTCATNFMIRDARMQVNLPYVSELQTARGTIQEARALQWHVQV